MISELLIHFRQECAKYSTRNPTHPFVDVLRNSNDSDYTNTKIYEQISFILEDKRYFTESNKFKNEFLNFNLRINANEAYKLLKPVFIYIFMEKNNLKHLIASLLIKKLENKMDYQILELVTFYFESLKVFNIF